MKTSKIIRTGSTILHWEFQHFVVLARVDRRWVEIVDPAVGPRKVPIDEVRRAFTGVALTFEPNELFQKQGRGGAIFSAMKSLMVGSGLLPSILITPVFGENSNFCPARTRFRATTCARVSSER